MNCRGHRIIWGLLLLAISLGGCKRKEPAHSPALPAPEKIYQSVGLSGKQGILPVQAEVSASSGPVQLTLRVYRTQIQAHHPLYYQIELKNLGTRSFPVVADLFIDPMANYWTEPVGVHLDFIGPDGKAPGVKPMPAIGQWGFEPNRLDKLPPPQPDHGERATTASPKGALLAPQTSTVTVPWVLQDSMALARGEALRQPIGQFTEACLPDFASSGRYRVRAVYDYRPDGWSIKFYKAHHLQPAPEDVRVETPFVEFSVTP